MIRVPVPVRAALALCLGFALAEAAPARAASLDGDAVEVVNTTEPVLCAEKDNVTLLFKGAPLRSFRVEALHPAYMGSLAQDNYKPDFTACGELTKAAEAAPPPTKETIYESVGLWITGFRFPDFWRKNDIPIRIGGHEVRGYDLIQLWIRHDERAEEVLVLYPGDGYWRLRPLPPEHLAWSAYGSSVLIGPVEQAGRPVVAIKAIDFDPRKRAFTVDFVRGGRATLAISELDRNRHVVDVGFENVPADRPIAALRSMYVTEFNADVARVAVRAPNDGGWREETILGFKGGMATDIWTGRLVPSRHNTSAPDMIFSRFKKAGP